MLGKWRTSAESHADTFLDIRRTRIGFGYGQARPPDYYTIFRIERVRPKHAALPLYTIEYLTPDGSMTISMWFDDLHSVIRLNHRWGMIWRREGDEREPTTGEEASRRSPTVSSPPTRGS